MESGMKSCFIYKVLFFDNQESKQKYYGTLIQFFSFHLNSHTLGFYSTKKLKPPCTLHKQYFLWYCFLCNTYVEGGPSYWVCE